MIPGKTTKELLGESLRELSENKPLDKSTIREIVENCRMVARRYPELYRLFGQEEEPGRRRRRRWHRS